MILDYITRYLSMSQRNRLEQCEDCGLRSFAYDWQLYDQLPAD